MSRIGGFLEISKRDEASFIDAARNKQRITGLTHDFYKYPARFSPAFVRSAIQTFTKPGDFCLDPHVGGGTTLVEALALGRHSAGVDVSTLAEFVCSVKTSIFSERELATLNRWANRVVKLINVHNPSRELTLHAELGYYRHLNDASRWRLRKAIEQSIESAERLSSPKLVAFGRCAVLRTAQWALDARIEVPSIEKFKTVLGRTTFEMIQGSRALAQDAREFSKLPSVKVLNRSSTGLENDGRLRSLPAPKLVLTSPPYPGVHVLYHRWQVDGGKEVPLPFMIANKLDGAGGSYYTMGDRKQPDLNTYFESIRLSMKSVAALADNNTTFVQMVAFSDSSWQLPRYLKAMSDAGLIEAFLPILKGRGDGRLWRSVPNRRWYADQRGSTSASKEVVLIHRKARS